MQQWSYGRFPKFHSVFLGRDLGTLKSDTVSKKHPQLICSGLRILKLKIRRLKLWKATVLCSENLSGNYVLDGGMHASAQAMTRLLERAGVPKEALEIIPDIVDTCAACRTWSQPLPQSIASVNIPDKFNGQVPCDIVFIHSHAILHYRCTTWHTAVIATDKSEDSVIKALHSHWVSIHGPMRELIMDG